MKLVVIRSNLKEAIGLIDRATGDVPNLPILKNALIQAKDGRITISATNLEIGIQAVISGKIIEQGSVVVPLSLLIGLLNGLQSDRLNFEVKGTHIELTTDNYSATLQGFPSDEFPQLPKIQDGDNIVSIKGVILKDAIQQVVAASQLSDIRPELNSTLFDFSLESLKLAATDGFRLAEKTIPKNAMEVKKENNPFRILVPLKAAQEASRDVSNEEIVSIYHDKNQVLFKTERVEIISRLINGQFPDYSTLIPEKFKTEILVNREEFTNAVKVVSVLGQKNSEMALTLRQDKKNMIIHSSDQALGENQYLIPVKAKGDGLDILFNWRHIADAMKALSGEEIFFGFQEESNPALIKSANDSSYFYILKPLMKG